MRLSKTMHADFCVEAVYTFGPREIMNTDQRHNSPFLPGSPPRPRPACARCMDNTFIERLWRSPKQEAFNLEEINDGFQARSVISNWMTFYNTERPHSSLERRTPREAYRNGQNRKLAA